MKSLMILLVMALMPMAVHAHEDENSNKSAIKAAIEKYGLAPSAGIQEERPFWGLSLGFMVQPTPTDTLTVPRFNFSYTFVDESLLQTFEVKLGMSSASQIVDLGYGIGFGQRMGYWHVGWLVNLGYAHLDDQSSVHGLHYATGPMVNFGFPWKLPSLRFHIAGGWAGLAVSSGDFPSGKALKGGFLEIGVGLSIQYPPHFFLRAKRAPRDACVAGGFDLT